MPGAGHGHRMNDTRRRSRTGEARVDVVMYPSGDVKAVPAGKGGEIVRSFRERTSSSGSARRLFAWALVLFVVVYSLLIVRNLLLGIVAAGVVYAVVLLLPGLTGSDASLLDSGVTLRAAREQWEATPVAELESPRPDEGDRRREREHAFEGDVG